ncbi:MAG TPA: hypothetical protein VFC19_29295 [Candidatus Limnocylindrales bacterium]|nr:hypothetical protein [Candidatus Limnocylindrales bacterium]
MRNALFALVVLADVEPHGRSQRGGRGGLGRGGQYPPAGRRSLCGQPPPQANRLAPPSTTTDHRSGCALAPGPDEQTTQFCAQTGINEFGEMGASHG